MREGEGEVEGESHLKIHFHGDQCKRAITVRGFFSSRETQRCCSALGETSSINSAGIVSCRSVLNTYDQE